MSANMDDVTLRAGLLDDVPCKPMKPCMAEGCEFTTSGGVCIEVEPGSPTLIPMCCAHREVFRATNGWPLKV